MCIMPRTSKHRAARTRGFTLVELMAVMLILAILMTFVIGGAKLLTKDVYVKETKNTINIVMSAIKVYQEETKSLPAQGGDWVGQLVSIDKSRAQIEKLDKKIWSASNNKEILDGWGKPIQYVSSEGLAGAADLISSGPDGDPSTEEDNVRYNR